MDPALKQRLIGAAVLVALAVIFLPMLLKGPAPDGGASHVPLDMPAEPDRRFETRELPLVPQPRTPDGGATGMQPLDEDPNRIVTIDTDAPERPDALTGEDMRSDVAATPSAVPSDAPAPVADASAPAAREDVEVAGPEPGPAPAAQPEPEPGPALPATTAGGGYAVNLGSYGNLANARELVQRMGAAGLPAFSEDVALGDQQGLRVRVGPFASRAEAEVARQRALGVRNDLPASVVSVDAATGDDAAPASPSPDTAASTGFAVQLGAFRSETDAQALVTELRGAGFTVFSERVQTANGTLYRVRVGPELDRAAAERLKARLPAPHAANGMIVSHP